MEYLIWLCALWGVFSLLVLTLNLMLGEAGLFSLSHAAFLGLGAYTTAILITRYDVYPVAAFLISVAIGLALSVTLIFFIREAKGDFFALATFAASLAFHSLILNWIDVSGGAYGLVVPLQKLGFNGNNSIALMILIPVWLLVVAIFILTFLWGQSPLGRVLNAIREDDVLAVSLGKRVSHHRIIVFAFASSIATASGALYMLLTSGVVNPSSFTAMDSVMLVAMVVIGGAGSNVGAIIGAGLLIFMPEVLRQIGFDAGDAANIRQIVFGSMLYLMLLYRPQGLLGRLRVGTEVRA